jgi:hypothetical protein
VGFGVTWLLGAGYGSYTDDSVLVWTEIEG